MGRKPYHEISLLDFQDQFPDEESCWKYLIAMRWPEGFACPGCKHGKADLISSRKVYECRGCGKQTSVSAGTAFHKSRTPLRKWFWAIFLMSTSKKSVPMLYLQSQLGIKSYRTAWLMAHKIRQAMAKRDELYKLKGTVEADEIFIGGKQSLDDRRKFGTNKTSFFMAVEEGAIGNPRFVTFEEIENVFEEHVLPALQKHIEKGSKIKSDGAAHYVVAEKKMGYPNERSVAMTSPEQTAEHLKWINKLTSNLKRFLLSTHHGVFPKYRKKYLAEFAYRFNRRYWPHQAFDRLLFACLNAGPTTLPELTA